MRKIERLPAKRLRQLLDYDPETGVFAWRKRTGPMCKFGVPAGSVRADGYWRIGVDGVQYVGHQLAWLHFYGEHPAQGIDHVNGTKTDNRIANLRLATPHQNACNAKRRVSQAGYRGVKKYHRRFIAEIKHDGRKVYLGTFDTAEEAYAAWCRKAVEIRGEFARLSNDQHEDVMKLKPEVCREIIRQKRQLRRARMGTPGHVKEQVWVGLKSLTEVRQDPARPGLATQVAINVARARQAAGA